MTFNEKLDKLPAYVYCDGTEDCEHSDAVKHYLNFSKDIKGQWCVGYCEYETQSVLHGSNEFKTLEAAADWILEELAITV